jgi:hypothetical protein
MLLVLHRLSVILITVRFHTASAKGMAVTDTLIIVCVVKYGGSGSVFDYVRVTINNGVLLQGELYSRQPSKLVGKLVSKP